MKRPVLVTGGAGNLGRRVVKLLLDKRYRVRVAALNARSARERLGAKCEIVEMDLARAGPDDLLEAVNGCESVVNLAGLISGTEAELMSSNLEATRRVLTAARRAGVKRFVHCSSSSVYGNPQKVANEDYPKAPVTAYGRSKLLAEDAVKAGGVPFVILRPCIFYGEGFAVGFKEVISMAKRGAIIQIGDGNNRIPFVHADDVAQAFLLALGKKGIEGKAFNLCGGPVTQKEAFRIAVKAVGAKPRVIRISKKLAYSVARALDLALEAAAKAPKFAEYVRVLSEDRCFDASKARKLLGWRPRAKFAKEAAKVAKSLAG
jgi:nucleoside-diphosphate-sugar epimerase